MIEYCIGNVPKDARARLRALEHRTQPARCLQRCGTCWEGPMLVVDGTVQTGPDHEALLDAVEDD